MQSRLTIANGIPEKHPALVDVLYGQFASDQFASGQVAAGPVIDSDHLDGERQVDVIVDRLAQPNAVCGYS